MKQGREKKGGILRKFEDLEKVVKVSRAGLRPDSGKGNLTIKGKIREKLGKAVRILD